MAASGRDIVVFFVGLAGAGLAPVVVFPSLDPAGLLALLADAIGGIPLYAAVVVVLAAMLAAAWVDTAVSETTELRG